MKTYHRNDKNCTDMTNQAWAYFFNILIPTLGVSSDHDYIFFSVRHRFLGWESALVKCLHGKEFFTSLQKDIGERLEGPRLKDNFFTCFIFFVQRSMVIILVLRRQYPNCYDWLPGITKTSPLLY